MADGFDGADRETEIKARINYNPLNDLKMRKLEGKLMEELVRLAEEIGGGPFTPGKFRERYPTIWDLVERYDQINRNR